MIKVRVREENGVKLWQLLNGKAWSCYSWEEASESFLIVGVRDESHPSDLQQ